MTLPAPAAARVAAHDRRPALVLIAVDMGRGAATEPGKAWNWACALARHYRLHVVTAPAVAERCRVEELASDWQWHVTRAPAPTTMGWRYYRDYARWCRDVPGVVAEAVRVARPVRLHHITLGSFRMIPRYDRCGVAYSLGPLGGGETTPWPYLRTARFPWSAMLSEIIRPWANRGCARLPSPRAVVRGAQLVLTTTPETEQVLQRMGARRTGVVFPDRVPPDVDPALARSTAERAAELRSGVRLIWAGRALWWKGGQLAIELMRRLAATGVEARLTMFSYGPALEAWCRQIAQAGLDTRCEVRGFVARAELLRELGRAHGFVYPTLHDSSSSALLEAYALGLPSLSVGIGGPAVVATPATGYNARAADLTKWLDGAAERVRTWQRAPKTWITDSDTARVRASDFGADHLEAAVARWLAPSAITR